MCHVIITTANIPDYYESRKAQYIASIEACLKFSNLFTSYTILECVSEKQQYLDPYNTYYSTEGNPYPNKGLNELNHIRAFLKQSNLADTAPIIKLSGKYIIEDSYFFDNVIALRDDYDSVFKSDNDAYEGNGYHTFFYYIKKKLFLDAIDNVEFSVENEIPIEWDFKTFFLTRDRHIEIDRLGIIAHQGINSELIFSA